MIEKKMQIEMLAELMTIQEVLVDILKTKDRDIQELKIANLGLHVGKEAKKIIDRM